MRKGMLFAATAYVIWGLLPLYFKALQSIAPTQIMLHRMVWSLLFLLCVLALRKQWSWLGDALRKPKVLGAFLLSALLLSTNWFTYIWAVNNDRIIDSSLGYFINPLVNVLLGYVVLGERLRAVQWLAIALAACGVAWLTWITGQPPWIGLILAVSFGFYGLMRKTAKLGPLEGLSLETLLLFPFALAALIWLTLQQQNAFIDAPAQSQWLLLAAGPITAIPLLLFAAGARRIPMATLGLLQYIAPSLQLALGVLLYNESFSSNRLIGFAAIWSALVLYSGESVWRSWRARKSAVITES